MRGLGALIECLDMSAFQIAAGDTMPVAIVASSLSAAPVHADIIAILRDVLPVIDQQHFALSGAEALALYHQLLWLIGGRLT